MFKLGASRICVLQGPVLGPFLMLIYIDNPPDHINSFCKISADETSLFSTVYDKNTFRNELNNDLRKINDWAFQWKMSFNLIQINTHKKCRLNVFIKV